MVRDGGRKDIPIPHERVTQALMADARFEYDQRQKVTGAGWREAGAAGDRPTMQSNEAGGSCEARRSAPGAAAAMAGLAALEGEVGAQTDPHPPVPAMKPPGRMGHPESEMQASMGMAGGGTRP